MLTHEQLKGFLSWYEQDPGNRVVNIEISDLSTLLDHSPVIVSVYDRRIGVSQIVNDVSEIDLISKKRQELHRLQNELDQYDGEKHEYSILRKWPD